MTDKPKNPPVFPQYTITHNKWIDGAGEVDETITEQEGGITLRDYFAAKAMNGFAADPSSHNLYADMQEMAKAAYDVADAMLKAREAE